MATHHIYMARIAQMCADVITVIGHQDTESNSRCRIVGTIAMDLDALIHKAYQALNSPISPDQHRSMARDAVAIIQSAASWLDRTLPPVVTWEDVQTSITEDARAILSFTGIEI